jgi:hypothetical protein
LPGNRFEALKGDRKGQYRNHDGIEDYSPRRTPS